jgi:hypothetical protein
MRTVRGSAVSLQLQQLLPAVQRKQPQHLREEQCRQLCQQMSSCLPAVALHLCTHPWSRLLREGLLLLQLQLGAAVVSPLRMLTAAGLNRSPRRWPSSSHLLLLHRSQPQQRPHSSRRVLPVTLVTPWPCRQPPFWLPRAPCLAMMMM